MLEGFRKLKHQGGCLEEVLYVSHYRVGIRPGPPVLFRDLRCFGSIHMRIGLRCNMTCGSVVRGWCYTRIDRPRGILQNPNTELHAHLVPGTPETETRYPDPGGKQKTRNYTQRAGGKEKQHEIPLNSTKFHAAKTSQKIRGSLFF